MACCPGSAAPAAWGRTESAAAARKLAAVAEVFRRRTGAAATTICGPFPAVGMRSAKPSSRPRSAKSAKKPGLRSPSPDWSAYTPTPTTSSPTPTIECANSSRCAATITGGELAIDHKSTDSAWVRPEDLDDIAMHPPTRLRIDHYLQQRPHPCLGPIKLPPPTTPRPVMVIDASPPPNLPQLRQRHGVEAHGVNHSRWPRRRRRSSGANVGRRCPLW